MSSAFEYRSNLKQKDIPKFIITGIMTELIFSDIFEKENEISEFIDTVFRIETKKMPMKPAKVSRKRLHLKQ